MQRSRKTGAKPYPDLAPWESPQLGQGIEGAGLDKRLPDPLDRVCWHLGRLRWRWRLGTRGEVLAGPLGVGVMAFFGTCAAPVSSWSACGQRASRLGDVALSEGGETRGKAAEARVREGDAMKLAYLGWLRKNATTARINAIDGLLR